MIRFFSKLNVIFFSAAVISLSLFSFLSLQSVQAISVPQSVQLVTSKSLFAASKGIPPICTTAQESDPAKNNCELVCTSSTPPTTPCQDPAISCTSGNCDLITEYLAPAINVFSASFAVIAVISLILGGINYTTSEGDPQKVARAKVRIRNTIFAVVAYMFLYAFLQFLVPGGIFK